MNSITTNQKTEKFKKSLINYFEKLITHSCAPKKHVYDMIPKITAAEPVVKTISDDLDEVTLEFGIETVVLNFHWKKSSYGSFTNFQRYVLDKID